MLEGINLLSYAACPWLECIFWGIPSVGVSLAPVNRVSVSGASSRPSLSQNAIQQLIFSLVR